MSDDDLDIDEANISSNKVNTSKLPLQLLNTLKRAEKDGLKDGVLYLHFKFVHFVFIFCSVGY